MFVMANTFDKQSPEFRLGNKFSAEHNMENRRQAFHSQCGLAAISDICSFGMENKIIFANISSTFNGFLLVQCILHIISERHTHTHMMMSFGTSPA
jgi:hypothetical protein